MRYELPKEKLLPECFPKDEKADYKTDKDKGDTSDFIFLGIAVFGFLCIYLIIEFSAGILEYFRNLL